jgi:hypothetical protein
MASLTVCGGGILSFTSCVADRSWQGEAGGYTGLLSRACGMVGLGCLVDGEADEAYEFLQKSARCVGRHKAVGLGWCHVGMGWCRLWPVWDAWWLGLGGWGDDESLPKSTRSAFCQSICLPSARMVMAFLSMDHRLAGRPLWRYRSAGNLGAFYILGPQPDLKEAMAVWEEAVEVGSEGAGNP